MASQFLHPGREWLGHAGVQRDPAGRIALVFPKAQPEQHDDLVLGALAELS